MLNLSDLDLSHQGVQISIWVDASDRQALYGRSHLLEFQHSPGKNCSGRPIAVKVLDEACTSLNIYIQLLSLSRLCIANGANHQRGTEARHACWHGSDMLWEHVMRSMTSASHSNCSLSYKSVRDAAQCCCSILECPDGCQSWQHAMVCLVLNMHLHYQSGLQTGPLRLVPCHSGQSHPSTRLCAMQEAAHFAEPRRTGASHREEDPMSNLQHHLLHACQSSAVIFRCEHAAVIMKAFQQDAHCMIHAVFPGLCARLNLNRLDGLGPLRASCFSCVSDRLLLMQYEPTCCSI